VREECLAVREGDPLGSRKPGLVGDGDAVNVRPDHATREGWRRGKRKQAVVGVRTRWCDTKKWVCTHKVGEGGYNCAVESEGSVGARSEVE
jgi:hypothetical protein